MPTIAAPREDEQHPVETLLKYAGLAALVLGGVYAYGAVVKGVEVAAAGQAVETTLPLFPPEQLLIVGMEKAFTIGITLAVVGLLAVVLRPAADRWYTDPERRRKREERKRAREQHQLSPRANRIWNVVIVLSWSFAILVSPPAYILLFTLLALVYWMWSQRVSYFRILWFSGLAWVVLTVGLTVIDPHPLPVAHLTMRDGRVVTGDLIVKTDDTWYVGTGDRQFTSIPARTVVDSSVDTPENPPQGSVFQKIFG